MALSTNLVAYWKLDESSGNAADSVGSNTLTNTNTVGYAAALINNGADFGTSVSHNKTLHNAGLGVDLSGAASWSGWIKIRTEPTGTSGLRFVDWRSATGTSRYLICGYEDNAGTKRIRLDASGTIIGYNVTLGTSAWHHVVVTYSASGTVTLYLDGSSVSTGSRGTGTVTASFDIGNGVEKVTGQATYMDEIGAWSRELTSTEVTQLYKGGAGLAYPFGTAYTLTATAGSFSLTGYAVTINRLRNMAAAVGSFALTGYAATFSRGKGIAAAVGSFILTGYDAVLTWRGWKAETKHTGSYTAETKNSSTWTPESKNS